MRFLFLRVKRAKIRRLKAKMKAIRDRNAKAESDGSDS